MKHSALRMPNANAEDAEPRKQASVLSFGIQHFSMTPVLLRVA
jgi:hypothetical protein